ncbi:YbaB/EbfC family nucleoid-associated protein [Glycomyces algeriensis]|nr:YbaB/EbfC family nucleoid-associated protein [Glycomyces algeriensis]MDA1364274.1 YbaB/EbfC family nucleoid-associated protein [Glycomyces algeriensis]MDR7350304.1 DNA-binding protein YbaB [Glycomyces algeriensis]
MREFQGRMASMVEKASSLGEAMEAAQASASSPEGEVTVTVGIGGSLQDLQLSPASRQMSAQALAALIKETYREAAEQAGRSATGALASVFGEDNDLVRQARARSQGEE